MAHASARNQLMRSLIWALAAFTLIFGGCNSERKRYREQLEAAAPLPFDPTEKYELARWWSNDNELLRLDDSAAYALFDSQNRYRRPIERGRWSQRSFDVLWLEPYSKLKPDRKRVAITKVNGRIMLELPRLKPMRGLQEPPPMIEDRLIGQWQGPLGTLLLGSDLRYELDPGKSSQAARVSSRSGSWSVDNGQLVLLPDAPGLDPVVLTIVAEQKEVKLSRDGMIMKMGSSSKQTE
jgi:hypothetical protein